MKRRCDPIQQELRGGKTARISSLQAISNEYNSDDDPANVVQMATKVATPVASPLECRPAAAAATTFPPAKPLVFTVNYDDDNDMSHLWVEDDDWGGVPRLMGVNTSEGRRLYERGGRESDSAGSSENPDAAPTVISEPQVACLSQSPPASRAVFAQYLRRLQGSSSPAINRSLAEDTSGSDIASYAFGSSDPEDNDSTTSSKDDEEQNRPMRPVSPFDWPWAAPRRTRGSFHPAPRRWVPAVPVSEATPCGEPTVSWRSTSPLLATPEPCVTPPGSSPSSSRGALGSWRKSRLPPPVGSAEPVTLASLSVLTGSSSSFRPALSLRPAVCVEGESWRRTEPVASPTSWRRNVSPQEESPSCCDLGNSMPSPMMPRVLDYPVMDSPRFRWTPAPPLSDYGFNITSSYSQPKTRDSWFPPYDENDFKDVERMPFIDTHCHLDFLFKRLEFSGSLSSYIRVNPTLFPISFQGCVAVFCDPKTFGKEETWKYLLEDANVWAAFGCHPKMAQRFNPTAEQNLMLALNHPKVVALGEIGLDYSSRNNCDKEIQKTVFRSQIQLALKRNLPIVIHARNAEDDTLEIMKELIPRNYKIHRHCFGGDWPCAQKLLEYFPNLYIGLTSLVTYPSAKDAHKVARHIPLDRLVLETDAPYFVPKKVSGATRVSNPGMAIHVAAQIAALRWDDTFQDVLDATRRNTRYLYGI